MIGTIWRAIRHMGHNDIGVMNPSGNGGRSSGDGQDGGSRVGSERAGEAEWSKGREGKTEQEDVQYELEFALIAVMAVGAFSVYGIMEP